MLIQSEYCLCFVMHNLVSSVLYPQYKFAMVDFISDQELIISYNLHPDRWKVRRKRAAIKRNIVQLVKENRRLRDLIYNMEYEELQVPIQRGYVRKYELSEWAKHTPEAPVFEEILPKINVFEYTNSKEFPKRKKRKKLRKYRYVKYGDPKLLDLKINQYNTLSEKAKLYFHPIEKFNNRARMWITYYRFSDPQVFEYKITPYFLTKVKKRNWEAEKRSDEIEYFVVTQKNFTKTENTRKAYRWYLKDDWFCKPRLESPLKNRPIYEFYEEYKEEKELWEYIYNQKN